MVNNKFQLRVNTAWLGWEGSVTLFANEISWNTFQILKKKSRREWQERGWGKGHCHSYSMKIWVHYFVLFYLFWICFCLFFAFFFFYVYIFVLFCVGQTNFTTRITDIRMVLKSFCFCFRDWRMKSRWGGAYPSRFLTKDALWIYFPLLSSNNFSESRFNGKHFNRQNNWNCSTYRLL